MFCILNISVSGHQTLQIGVISGIYCHERETNDSLEIPVPQINSREFRRSWTGFELVATTKEWNATKQLAVVPTLLWGKLINYYLNHSEAKKRMSRPESSNTGEGGLKSDPLMASKLFNERVLGP